MLETNDRIEKLQHSNRLLRRVFTALAGVILLGAGMAMQAGRDSKNAPEGTTLIEASEAVSDPSGFAVFVRSDGNVVIVKEDGTIIRTSTQPMAVGF